MLLPSEFAGRMPGHEVGREVNPRVTVHLFGGVDVSAEGVSIIFPSRKATTLFAYLTLHRGRQLSRARLADLLWEEADEGSGRRNLSTTLWRVRTAFKESDGVKIVAADDTLALACDSKVLDVDVERFNGLIAERNGSDEERLSALQAAEGLYKGDLLEGYDTPWVEEDRRYYAACYRDVLQSISALLLESDDYESCIQYLEKLLRCDPLSDETTSKLMLAYHLTGRRSTALALYDRFKSILNSELGQLPSEATTELWNRVRKQANWVAPGIDSNRTSQRSDFHVGELPLVGREKELGMLVSLLNTSVETPTVCAITGDGGVGKTRLASALSEEAAMRGYEVLQGRCPDLQSPPPYQVFVQALWPRIERHLNTQGPLSRIVERLATTVAPQDAESVLDEVTQISGSVIVLEVLLRLLTDSSSPRGTLLLLEDLHRVDRASEALLISLADRAPKARLVVVATMRDDASSARALLQRLSPWATMVDLRPLGRMDTERLASAILGVSPIPSELGDLLWSTTGGVPLFSIELVTYLADRGYLAKTASGITTFDLERLKAERPNFPTRIMEVLRKRVETLGDSARAILSSVAVLGAEVGFLSLKRCWVCRWISSLRM